MLSRKLMKRLYAAVNLSVNDGLVWAVDPFPVSVTNGLSACAFSHAKSKPQAAFTGPPSLIWNSICGVVPWSEPNN